MLRVVAESAGIWFRRLPCAAEPRLRLVCFPHAGGTASMFHNWARLLPADVEVLAVRYPGRQERYTESCIDRMDELADQISSAIAPFTDRPFAIFGHSMGSSVGYEVTARLEARAGVSPVILFVSGSGTPHRAAHMDLNVSDDGELLAEISRLGGMDVALFDAPDVVELLMPALRADYRLVQAYRPLHAAPVQAPIVGYTGISDPLCSAEDIKKWCEVTSARFDFRVFAGGHFYLNAYESELVSDVASRLSKALLLVR